MQREPSLAVFTDEGAFCSGCVPPKLEDNPESIFTVSPDIELNYYPVCEACGEKHTYMPLTDYGAKFELEIRGPEHGDVLLAECGPGDRMLEMSIIDDRIVGVFAPYQRTLLREHVEKHLQSHPDAVVWYLQSMRLQVELAPPHLWKYDPFTDDVYVNRAA